MKGETKTITYKPETQEILKTLKLEDDYGFQLVKFQNNIFGVNYINPVKGIQETVMVSTDKGINIGPVSFIRFAEEAYNSLDFDEIEKVELAIYVDPENREIYREVIKGEEAKTLMEKLEIARELVELKHENSLTYKYEDFIILIMMGVTLVCIILAILNSLHLYGGI